MQDVMIRIYTDDVSAWMDQHYAHASNRARFGIHDGPVYQDLENPNAVLFHIRVDDMARAQGWFQSETFQHATALAKVTGREFYLAARRS